VRAELYEVWVFQWQSTFENFILFFVQYVYSTRPIAGEIKERETGATNSGWENGTWWDRRWERHYIPAISLRDTSVVKFLKYNGQIIWFVLVLKSVI
jgi:hypothetical protein